MAGPGWHGHLSDCEGWAFPTRQNLLSLGNWEKEERGVDGWTSWYLNFALTLKFADSKLRTCQEGLQGVLCPRGIACREQIFWRGASLSPATLISRCMQPHRYVMSRKSRISSETSVGERRFEKTGAQCWKVSWEASHVDTFKDKEGKPRDVSPCPRIQECQPPVVVSRAVNPHSSFHQISFFLQI